MSGASRHHSGEDLGPLFVRLGHRIVEAPEEDQAVLRRYGSWPEKGETHDHQRLTIMTRAGAYRAGEEIRIVHVYEVTGPGKELFVMGPKPVFGECVDEVLISAPPLGAGPFGLLRYDGRVLPSPGIDSNFEITSYRFTEPATTHRIVWKVGELVSNTLVVEITP